MNTKKFFSLLLAIVMLFSVMSVGVYAEGETGKVYSAKVTHTLSEFGTVSETLFSVDATIDESKFTCFDGGSADYTINITSVIASYQTSNINGNTIEIVTGDYIADAEVFFAVFERQTADRDAIDAYNNALLEGQSAWKPADKVTIDVFFDITFTDPTAFGTLNYTVSLNVMEPLDIDIPIVGDALSSAVAVPTTEEKTGTIAEFPYAVSTVMSQKPSKNEYYDNEKFELNGVKFDITTSAGDSGTVTYRTSSSDEGSANSYMFSCVPSEKELLPVSATSVILYFDGEEAGKTPVSVTHKWSDGFVNITTDKWTSTKPGYHAIVCEGCGETHDAQPHIIDEETWVANDDQTFVNNGTESTKCLDCGATVTRDALGSADFNEAFENYHFLKVIFEYINLILRIIGNAGIN